MALIATRMEMTLEIGMREDMDMPQEVSTAVSSIHIQDQSLKLINLLMYLALAYLIISTLEVEHTSTVTQVLIQATVLISK